MVKLIAAWLFSVLILQPNFGDNEKLQNPGWNLGRRKSPSRRCSTAEQFATDFEKILERSNIRHVIRMIESVFFIFVHIFLCMSHQEKSAKNFALIASARAARKHERLPENCAWRDEGVLVPAMETASL